MSNILEISKCATKVMDALIKENPEGISFEDIREIFLYIESQFSNLKVINLKGADIIF